MSISIGHVQAAYNAVSGSYCDGLAPDETSGKA